MIGKEFVGKIGVNKPTPNGGMVSVAFGNIDETIQAIGFRIADGNNDVVAEFALLPETFGILIEVIKELYDESL